jgi:hypothetical protein
VAHDKDQSWKPHQNWPGSTAEGELGLVQCTQAASADLFSNGLAILVDGDFLNVWFPLPLGPDVGVADIVPKRGRLAAYLTLGHGFSSPT